MFQSIDGQERRNHFYVFLVGFAQPLTLQTNGVARKISAIVVVVVDSEKMTENPMGSRDIHEWKQQQ